MVVVHVYHDQDEYSNVNQCFVFKSLTGMSRIDCKPEALFVLKMSIFKV